MMYWCDKSEEGVVALGNVKNCVVSMMSFGEYGELVMVGEMSALDMKLVEHITRSFHKFKYLINVGILQFSCPTVMMFLDF